MVTVHKSTLKYKVNSISANLQDFRHEKSIFCLGGKTPFRINIVILKRMRLLKNLLLKLLILGVLILAFHAGLGQTKILKGIIKDSHSGEPIPFASMRFRKAGTGRLSDAAGGFEFRFPGGWPKDTLEITYVGFLDLDLLFSDSLIGRARQD